LACKLSEDMARPEGFEPPTLRSEEWRNTKQQELSWNKSPKFILPSYFHIICLHTISCSFGDILETTPKKKHTRLTGISYEGNSWLRKGKVSGGQGGIWTPAYP
jgi:hypothetical protein